MGDQGHPVRIWIEKGEDSDNAHLETIANP